MMWLLSAVNLRVRRVARFLARKPCSSTWIMVHSRNLATAFEQQKVSNFVVIVSVHEFC